MAVAFLLLVVVKPIGSHSSKLIQSVCQCFRIVVLLVSDHVDHYHLPNSVVLPEDRHFPCKIFSLAAGGSRPRTKKLMAC